MRTFRNPETGETVHIPDDWTEIQMTRLPVAYVKPGCSIYLHFAERKDGSIALTKTVCGVEYGHSVISLPKANVLMEQLDDSGWEQQY